MNLFNNVDLDLCDDSIIDHHFDETLKQSICDYYVKMYNEFYGQHMNCSLTYKIVDDKLACFAETHNRIMPDENKNNNKYDDFILPFSKNDINLMVKFNSAYNIEYMRGKIITYSPSKNGKGADEELFLLRYANDLMNNHSCRIDEIIFTDEEEEHAWTLDSFDITMCYDRREAVANTPPLSEDFCKLFPKLSFMVPNKPLTNYLSFDRCHFASEKAFIYACNKLHEMYPKMAMSFNVATTYFGGHALWEGNQYFNEAFLNVVLLFEYKEHIDDYIIIDINKLNKCLDQMNELLYNKIITKISKIVKKSINEAYESIYGKMYDSFDDLSILNNSGLLGNILQINEFGGFRVLSKKDVNESSLFDIELLDKGSYDITDDIILWKDFAICVGPGLWVYLDWIGLHKKFNWAKPLTPLYGSFIKTSENGYENTLYILNNYKVKGTLWDEVKKCKYPVFIPSVQQLKKIYKHRKLLNLDAFYYWSSSLCEDCRYAFYVGFSNGSVNLSGKTKGLRSVTLLHF